MRIGIDISQIVHEGTGVATYVRRIVAALVRSDRKNEYVLFGASLRKRHVFGDFFRSIQGRVRLVTVPIPPTLLELLWNRLHIVPVEWFIGAVDVFWSSDWTQPPLSHAVGVTTIHDCIALKRPDETDARIVAAHKRRLTRVMKYCRMIFCDSDSTKRDVMGLFHVAQDRLEVVYPGYP